MPNEHGYGVHGPSYQRCPNCGTECISKTATSPVGGRKLRRCPECCPWWRVSVLLPFAALGLWCVALLFGFAVAGPVGMLVASLPNACGAIGAFLLGLGVFAVSGPKAAPRD